jgi:hypothetical protein
MGKVSPGKSHPPVSKLKGIFSDVKKKFLLTMIFSVSCEFGKDGIKL